MRRGKKPERGQPGPLLNRKTVVGPQLELENSLNVTSISVGAGLDVGIFVIHYAVYDQHIPDGDLTADNYLPSEDVILWPYFNVFYNTYDDEDQLMASQFNASMNILETINPEPGDTQTVYISVSNYGAAATIYLDIGTKYIMAHSV